MKHLVAHEASLGLGFLRDKGLQQTTSYVVYDPVELKVVDLQIIYLNSLYTKRLDRLRFFLCKICTRSMHLPEECTYHTEPGEEH